MSLSETFELKNGTVLLSIEAPGGVYNSSQLETIMRLMEAEGTIVKTTEDQRLAMLVAPDALERVTVELQNQGLTTRHYGKGLHQPVACIGELCPFSKQDALGAALSLTESLQGISCNGALRIGLNGCERSCVPTHSLDISLVGDEGGYKIFLGGKGSLIPEFASYSAEGVPAQEINDRIRQIVEFYQQSATAGESLHDLLEREGLQKVGEILTPYSQDALPPSINSNTSEPMETVMDNPVQELNEVNEEEVIREELFDDIVPEVALAEETLGSAITDSDPISLEPEEEQIPPPEDPPVILEEEVEPQVDINFKEIQSLAKITLEDSHESLSHHREEIASISSDEESIDPNLAEESLPVGEVEVLEPAIEELDISDIELEQPTPRAKLPLPQHPQPSRGAKISGVNLEPGGYLKLDLESGMSLRIHLAEVPDDGYELSLGGQKFVLVRSGEQIQLSLGLLEVTMPAG